MKREVVFRAAIIVVVLVAIFSIADYFYAAVSVNAATSGIGTSATINPSSTLAIGSDTVALDVVPSASGTFKASSALTVSAYTNSNYNCEIAMTTSNTSLTSTQGQNTYSIPTLTSGSTYTESTFLNDSWGYSLDNTTFNPVASSNSIATFSSTTANIASVYFAAKLTQATKPGTYSGTVIFTTTCTPPPIPLYNAVAAMSKGIFNYSNLNDTLTTENSGVYEYDRDTYGASDDATTHKIYFYRGIIDNTFADNYDYGMSGDGTLYPNYILLTTGSNMTCWRIFRTTGSGGIKMIYNGNWENNTCAKTSGLYVVLGSTYYNRGTIVEGDDKYGTNGFITYAGYNYNSEYAYNETSNTTAIDNSILFNNETASNIRTIIEKWYVDTIDIANNNLFETNAGYCNDRTIHESRTGPLITQTIPYQIPSTTYYFDSFQRLQFIGNPLPSLDCFNASGLDLLNNNVGKSYPVALITIDEVVLAGNGSYSISANSRSSYLSSSLTFTTLTPSHRQNGGNISVWCLDYRASTCSVYNNHGVRPVVSLVPGTIITGGSGTAADPWTVQ